MIGVGGVGGAIVRRLARDPMQGVRYLCVDTAEEPGGGDGVDRLVLPGLPRGSGRAAKTAYTAAQALGERLAGELGESQFALVVGSFGGGTGAGASPVIAQLARAGGGLAVILALEPLGFEGARRTVASNEAISFALGFADAVFRVPNRDVADICGADAPMKEALETIDEQVASGARSLMAMAAGGTRMSLDLGVLRRALASSQRAVMGYGQATGEGAMQQALRTALSGSFLYPEDLRRAQHVLLYVQGGEQLAVSELRAAARSLSEYAGDGELLVGIGPAPAHGEAVAVTVLGCGLHEAPAPQPARDDLPAQAVGPEQLFEGENLEIPAFIRRQRQRFSV